MIKQTIDQDLKTAMLAGDKQLVSVLRGLKSVILYSEVAESMRDKGLGDPQIVALLQKESKKRQEAADLYEKASSADRAQAELYEKQIIDGYLPAAPDAEELGKIVDSVIADSGEPLTTQTMGKVISKVKEETGGSADGATIAKLVRERLSQ